MGKTDRDNFNRKSFIKKLGGAAAGVAGFPFVLGAGKRNSSRFEQRNPPLKNVGPNDYINLGLIGAGGKGQDNISAALRYNGFRMVAACDLYESRLKRCKEKFGDDIFTTTDHLELLNRNEVDAVIIASTDHWHHRHAVDALRHGKPVYLEKPMTKTIAEGHDLIEAEQSAGIPLQVGSQRTSHIVYEKAGELYKAGEIGKLNYVEGYWDRYSAKGAWQYTIPPNVSTDEVDWETFREDLPAIPFDPKHFFRWRNYDEYGTGIPGDLFVHLFSGLHMITGALGPEKITASGGLRYWHDGRDAEDLVLGIYDYPETDQHPAFNLFLRVNFIDGSGGGSRIRLVGSEGEMEVSWTKLIVRKGKMPELANPKVGDLDEETRKEVMAEYERKLSEKRAELIDPPEYEYNVPDGYSDGYDHMVNFYKSIRDGHEVLQNGTFGLRAAGPALLTTESLRTNTIVNWDPTEMKVN
ncbi:Gfo/Idh/MocA family protein [Halalkalibaculum sp. DA3122]|uniref:Gfo/Idh/MocA family protein n=1 Tax=Halalkalibaculum sp. DA3122 TaxID=3373607 RepID=UPI0037543033